MERYDPEEMVTYYFILKECKDGKRIQAWSNDKSLAKFYMEFHKCKNFILKKYTNKMKEIRKLCEENQHDEIYICNFIVRDKKHKQEVDTILIPATTTEFQFVKEECNNFMSTYIAYAYINEAFPYLKQKYQDALKDILLMDVIYQVIHNQMSSLLHAMGMDQFMILFKCFRDNFGT